MSHVLTAPNECSAVWMRASRRMRIPPIVYRGVNAPSAGIFCPHGRYQHGLADIWGSCKWVAKELQCPMDSDSNQSSPGGLWEARKFWRKSRSEKGLLCWPERPKCRSTRTVKKRSGCALLDIQHIESPRCLSQWVTKVVALIAIVHLIIPLCRSKTRLSIQMIEPASWRFMSRVTPPKGLRWGSVGHYTLYGKRNSTKLTAWSWRLKKCALFRKANLCFTVRKYFREQK